MKRQTWNPAFGSSLLAVTLLALCWPSATKGQDAEKECCCPVAAANQFLFIDGVNAPNNTNILKVQITLKEAMEVHITANSSARSTGPVTFTTGFYNQPAANVMWTASYRRVTVPAANQFVNFGSTMSINLPAGTHTIYWKIWNSGSTVTFDSGVILVEAFCPSKTAQVAAAAKPSDAALKRLEEQKLALSKDKDGTSVLKNLRGKN